MVLVKGVRIGILYKLLGNVELSGCDNIVFPKVASSRGKSTKTNSIFLRKVDSTML